MVTNGCLIEAKGISSWQNDTAQICVFMRFLLLTSFKECQTITTHNIDVIPIGIVEFAFMLVWDNLCRNSCIMMHKRERFLVVRFARNIERDCSQGTNYLTELMLWSILQGGNSAPENELRPWNLWYTRMRFAPWPCPWSKTQEQDTSCVLALLTLVTCSSGDLINKLIQKLK